MCPIMCSCHLQCPSISDALSLHTFRLRLARAAFQSAGWRSGQAGRRPRARARGGRGCRAMKVMATKIPPRKARPRHAAARA